MSRKPLQLRLSTGGMMKRRIGMALVIAALVSFGSVSAVQADGKVNEKKYGSCTVWTENYGAGRKSHKFECREFIGPMNSASVALIWESGEYFVAFQPALPFSRESRVDVSWQIDDGEVRTEKRWAWLSDRGFAATQDMSLFQTLLNKFTDGRRIVIKVGNLKDEDAISLDGSGAAVQDLRARIAGQP